MSEPTPRYSDELDKLLLKADHTPYIKKVDKEVKTAIEQLINAEVLAVLDEAEKELNQMLGEDDSMQAVHTAITQLKQRYGGKEQENE